MIDYVIGDRKTLERTDRLMVGEEIYSDQSITVWIEKIGEGERKGKS